MHQTQRNAHRRILKRVADLPKRETYQKEEPSVCTASAWPLAPDLQGAPENSLHTASGTISLETVWSRSRQGGKNCQHGRTRHVGDGRSGDFHVTWCRVVDLASTSAHRLFNLCCVGESYVLRPNRRLSTSSNLPPYAISQAPYIEIDSNSPEWMSGQETRF